MISDDDIVCISSSNEDQTKEETSPIISKNRNPVKLPQKRRLTLAFGEDKDTKRFKPNDAKNTSVVREDSGSSVKSLVSHGLNKSCTNGQFSPEAGTSKYFDRIEKYNSRENSFSSKSSKALEPVRKIVKPQLVVKAKVKIPEPTDDVFENLLKTCIIKKDDVTIKEIIKRLRNIYDKVDPTEKSNEEFRLLMNRTNQRILDDASRLYTHIRDFRDEMKRRIKQKPNTDNNIKSEVSDSQQNKDVAEEKSLSKEDMAKVKKLEQAIKKCQQKIRELEEKEVDWENEEDSTYLQEDRYKRKLVELCKLLSDIVEDNTLKKQILKKKLRRRDILDEMSGIESVDEELISLVNSSVNNINKMKHIKRPTAVADYLKVPDYPDVLHCITKCNEKRGLGLSKKKMERLAEISFKAIGNHLKKQRIQESREYVKAIQDEYPEQVDPAPSDPKLNEALQENRKIGSKKLNAIFRNFVDLQDGLTPEELKKEVEGNSDSSSDLSEEETNETKSNKITNKNTEESSECEIVKEDITQNDQNKSSSENDKASKSKSEESILTVNNKKNTKNCEKDTIDKPKSVGQKSDSVHSIDEETIITDIKESGKTSANSSKSIIKNVDSEKQLENDQISISTVCKLDSVNKSNSTRNKESDQKEIIIADEYTSDRESTVVNEEDPLTIVADVEDDCDDDPKINSESNKSPASEGKIKTLLDIHRRDESDTTTYNYAANFQDESEDEIIELSKTDENCKINSATTNSTIQPLPSISNISKCNQDQSAGVPSNDEKIESPASEGKIKTLLDIHRRDESDTTTYNYAANFQDESEDEIIELSKTDENCKKNSAATNSTIQPLPSISNISKCNQDQSAGVPSNDEKIDEVFSVEKNVDLVKSKQNLEKSSSTKKPQPKNSLIVLNEKSKECAEEDDVIQVIESEEKEDLKESNEDGPEDKTKPESEKLYIKVRDFAIKPTSWKDSQSLSQESNKPTEIPNQQAHSNANEPDCIDLTDEPEKRSPSKNTRILNPLAVSQRRIPVQNVVVVKNVINNYMPLPSVRTRDISHTSNIRVNPHVGKNYAVSRRPDVVNRISHPSQPDIVRKPFVQPYRSKDQNLK